MKCVSAVICRCTLNLVVLSESQTFIILFVCQSWNSSVSYSCDIYQKKHWPGVPGCVRLILYACSLLPLALTVSSSVLPVLSNYSLCLPTSLIYASIGYSCSNQHNTACAECCLFVFPHSYISFFSFRHGCDTVIASRNLDKLKEVIALA